MSRRLRFKKCKRGVFKIRLVQVQTMQRLAHKTQLHDKDEGDSETENDNSVSGLAWIELAR